MNTVSLHVVVLIVAVFTLSEARAAESYQESFRLPISEAAYRVETWLEKLQFKTERTKLKSGTVRIKTIENGEKAIGWMINLTSQSTLATEVTVFIDGNDQASEAASDLFESLKYEGKDYEDYIAGPPTIIPSGVLDQIGNVACIYVKTKERSLQFSGFFIDSEGLIICTAHDLREQEGVKIKTNAGILYDGNIVKTDFERDLALIEVTAQKDGVVPVAAGRNLLAMGEQIFTIGCPINLRGTVHSGFVNGPPRSYHESPVWQVQMEIQPGSSGSPVFDRNGSFVGVIKGRHRNAEKTGFIIPLEIVMDFLKENFSQ